MAAQEDLKTLRAIHMMTVNLERIGDFCVNIARQTRYLSSVDFIHRLEYRDMFRNMGLPYSEVLQNILQTALNFSKDRQFDDDICLMAAEIVSFCCP